MTEISKINVKLLKTSQKYNYSEGMLNEKWNIVDTTGKYPEVFN